MADLKLRSSLILISVILAITPCKPAAAHDVTVDELLAYGFVIRNDSSTSSTSPASTDACERTTAVTTTPRPTKAAGCKPARSAPGDTISASTGATAQPPPTISPPADDDEGSDISDSDFVFAAGTCSKRVRLTFASRSWRGPALRAFFLTDSRSALPGLNARGDEGGEAFAFFPSEGAPELGGVVRSLRLGDTRAAAAPFAAHRHYGDTYKWMLYGDDDTVFFPDAARRLLYGLNPEVPIALSDNIWYLDRHPNPNGPRCLPCHLAANQSSLPSLEQIYSTADGRIEIRASFHKRGHDGTISQEEYLAFARNTTVVPGERYVPRPACPACTPEAACAPVAASGSSAPCRASIAHGGAGMIFSVGLMRSLPYRDALACFLTFANASGGDHMVSECLWRAGIAFTDPGELVRHGYSYQRVLFGGAPRLPMLLGLPPSGAAMSVPAGAPCDELCRWMLRRVVSMHMHARLHKNLKALAAVQAEAPWARKAALDQVEAMRREAEARGSGNSSSSSGSNGEQPFS